MGQALTYLQAPGPYLPSACLTSLLGLVSMHFTACLTKMILGDWLLLAVKLPAQPLSSIGCKLQLFQHVTVIYCFIIQKLGPITINYEWQVETCAGDWIFHLVISFL